MGSELVESSDPVGGEQHPSYSISKTFWNCLPHYLVMGMSVDEFWNQDPKLAEVYRDAYETKKRIQNENMWLQGAYVYHALCSASPMFLIHPQQPQSYLAQPFPLTAEEIEAQRIAEEKAKYEEQKAKIMAMAEAVNNSRKEV